MQGALLQVAKGAVQPRILGPSCHRETISGLPCQSSLATLEQSAVGTHGVFSGPAPWPLSLWGDLQLSCKGHYFDSFVCVHPQFLYFTFCFPCCICHNLACQKKHLGFKLGKKKQTARWSRKVLLQSSPSPWSRHHCASPVTFQAPQISPQGLQKNDPPLAVLPGSWKHLEDTLLSLSELYWEPVMYSDCQCLSPWKNLRYLEPIGAPRPHDFRILTPKSPPAGSHSSPPARLDALAVHMQQTCPNWSRNADPLRCKTVRLYHQQWVLKGIDQGK